MLAGPTGNTGRLDVIGTIMQLQVLDARDYACMLHEMPQLEEATAAASCRDWESSELVAGLHKVLAPSGTCSGVATAATLETMPPRVASDRIEGHSTSVRIVSSETEQKTVSIANKANPIQVRRCVAWSHPYHI